MVLLWVAYGVVGIGLIVLKVLFPMRVRFLGDVLNIFLLVIATISLHVAITAYQDAKRSGEEQTKALTASREALAGVRESLDKQELTLEKSRQALDSSVSTAIAQQQLLSQSVANSKTQLGILKAQWARELERPDIHATLCFPERPSVQLSNSSRVKPVRDGLYQLIMFNIDRPYSRNFQLVQTASTPLGTIPPSFSYLPSNLNILLDPAQDLTKGNRLFGYLSISCAECVTPRTYWALIKYGEEGWYREIKAGEKYPFPQLTPANIEEYVSDFLKHKDLIQMPKFSD